MANSDITKLQPIIGLPPSSYMPDYFIKNSFPIVEFTPATPSSEGGGLNVYKLTNSWGEYSDILKSHGYEADQEAKKLKLAVVADSFPTDTFSNEYSESFLDSIANTASAGMSAVAQMLGQRNLTGVADEAVKALENSGIPGAGMVAGGLKGASGMGDKMINYGKANTGKFGQMIGKAGSILNNTMAGARIDFPMVWGNSNFNPSYTFTVRLYNPNPGNLEYTKKYITGPLAAIMLLGLPISDAAGTYNWPFFSKISVPGLWNLNAGVITNITVIKGGDQQQIAWNNRMGMCDVRIDVISLYNTMTVNRAGDGENSDNPTLSSYLKNMSGERIIEKRVHEDPQFVSSTPGSNQTQLTNYVVLPGADESTTTSDQLVARVSESDSDLYNELNVSLPSHVQAFPDFSR